MSRAQLFRYALIASLLATPAFAKAQCSHEFQFRANPLIGLTSIRKLSQLLPIENAPHTKDGAELVIWPFDPEARPKFGNFHAIALVFATRGDLEEEVAGGMLLQDIVEPPLSLSKLTVEKTVGGVALKLPARGSCSPFIVKLLDGGSISVQGQIIGRLR